MDNKKVFLLLFSLVLMSFLADVVSAQQNLDFLGGILGPLGGLGPLATIIVIGIVGFLLYKFFKGMGGDGTGSRATTSTGDAERSTDIKEIEQAKKFISILNEILKKLDETMTASTLKNYLLRTVYPELKDKIKLLNDLEYKEIKLEHLTEERLRIAGLSDMRTDVEEMIEHEKNVLKNLNDLTEGINDWASALEEGEMEVPERYLRSVKEGLQGMKGIAILLININIEEIRKLK